jgi:hypothetical protein
LRTIFARPITTRRAHDEVSVRPKLTRTGPTLHGPGEAALSPSARRRSRPTPSETSPITSPDLRALGLPRSRMNPTDRTDRSDQSDNSGNALRGRPPSGVAADSHPRSSLPTRGCPQNGGLFPIVQKTEHLSQWEPEARQYIAANQRLLLREDGGFREGRGAGDNPSTRINEPDQATTGSELIRQTQ